MNIAKPPDENLSSDQFDFIESLGNGEKIKCDIETVQGRLTATNVFKADGNFILMPHNHAYNYKSPMMSHGNRQGQKTFLSYCIRIPTVKLKFRAKAFLKSESRSSVTFKL